MDTIANRLALTHLLKRPLRRSAERCRRQLKVLESLFLKLRSMTLIDGRTALCNRRGFMRAGSQLLEAQRRSHHGALVFCFDVDHLKVANDSAGHATGDALRLRTARLLRRVFRKRDILSRLDGDEFAVLAASSDPKGGAAIATRLRKAIAANNAGRAAPQLSLSVGMARFDPEQPLSLADLLLMADLAMYGDKLAQSLNTGNPLNIRSTTGRHRRRGSAFASRSEDSR